MAVQLISLKDFRDFIQEGQCIIILGTCWCKSAVMMSIIFDKMHEKYQNNFKFGKVDVENFCEIVNLVKVGAVPEFLIYKDGKLQSREHCTKAEELELFMDKFLEKINVLEKMSDYLY